MCYPRDDRCMNPGTDRPYVQIGDAHGALRFDRLADLGAYHIRRLPLEQLIAGSRSRPQDQRVTNTAPMVLIMESIQ